MSDLPNSATLVAHLAGQASRFLTLGLLHALEMRRDVWEARYVNLQQGGAEVAPKETRVRGGEMVEDAGWLL